MGLKKSNEQICHEFAGMILQQLIEVYNFDRRTLEDMYHLSHGTFNRFLDKEYVPGSRVPLDKMMLIVLDMEADYDGRIKILAHEGNFEKAESLYNEYYDFRESLRNKLTENINGGVGLRIPQE